MAYVNFWKLPAAQYNPSTHGKGIFQCSDTGDTYIFGVLNTSLSEENKSNAEKIIQGINQLGPVTHVMDKNAFIIEDGQVKLNFECIDCLNSPESKSEHKEAIPEATTSQNGLMSASDKAKVSELYTKNEIDQKLTDMTPSIGENGNWFVGGVDSGAPSKGADGVSLGEIALVQTTGTSAESVMSQNAVTEKFSELDSHISKITTEYNVSLFHPTEGVDGGNKYTLETAIAKVPAELRNVGIKCSFLDDGGKLQTWEYLGGAWAAGSFSQVGAAKLSELGKDIGIITINVNKAYNDISLNVSLESGTVIESINYSGQLILKNAEGAYTTIQSYPYTLGFDCSVIRGSQIDTLSINLQKKYPNKNEVYLKNETLNKEEYSSSLEQITGGELTVNVISAYADITLPFILKKGTIISNINSEYNGNLIIKQNEDFKIIDNYPYTLKEDSNVIRGSVVGYITMSLKEMFCNEKFVLDELSAIKSTILLDKNLTNQYPSDLYKGDKLSVGTYSIIVESLNSGINTFYLNGYKDGERTDNILPTSSVDVLIQFDVNDEFDKIGLVADTAPASEYNVKLFKGVDLKKVVETEIDDIKKVVKTEIDDIKEETSVLSTNQSKLLRENTKIVNKIYNLNSVPSVYEWLIQQPLEAGDYEIVVSEKTAKISGFQIVAYNEDNTRYQVLKSSIVGETVQVNFPKKSYKTRINFQNTVEREGTVLVDFYQPAIDIVKDVESIREYNPASYLRTPGDFLKVYQSNMYDCTTTVYSGDSIFGSGFGELINDYEQPPRLCDMLGFTRSLYEHLNKGKTINYRNVQHSDWFFTGNKEFVKIGSAPYGSEKVVKLSDGATAEISFTNAKKMIIFYQKGRSGTSYATGQLTMQISTNDGTSYSSMSDIVKGRTTKKGFGDVKVYDAAVDTINTSFTDELGYAVMGNDTANNRYSCYGKEVYNGLSESETYKVKITSQGENYIWGIAYTTEDVIHLVYNCSKPGFNWEQLCQSFWADIIETEADNVILEAPMYHDRTENNVIDGTEALFSLYEKYKINCILCSCPPGGVIVTGSTAIILGDDNASSYYPGEQFYTFYNQNRFLYFKTQLSDKNVSPDRFEKYRCTIDNIEYEVEVVQSVADKNINYVSVVVPKNFPKEIADVTFTKIVSSSDTTLSSFTCSAVDERISMEEHRDIILKQSRKYGYLFVDLLESFRDIAKQVGEDLDTEYWDMDENHPLYNYVLSLAQNASQYPDLNKWYLQGKPFPMNFMSNFFSISDGHHLQYNAQVAIWDFLKTKVFLL